MSGGTTTNEPAAAQSREGTAPSHQDLQSTIAPQLTTTGVEAQTQPEIPEGDEATVHYDVMLVDDPFVHPQDLEIPESFFDPMEVEEIITEVYIQAKNIATKFIVLQEDCMPLKKYPKLKLTQPTSWIGSLIPTAA